MKKDFSKKKSRVKSRMTMRWYWLASFLIVLTGAAFLYVDQRKQNPLVPIKSYVAYLENWMAERKNHINQNLEKVKRVAVNDENAPPIHFEFYTALPNMQVKVSEPKEDVKEKIVIAENKPVATKPLPEKNVVATSAIFDDSKLQHAIEQELNHPRYMIQLGVFKSASSAHQYRASLNKSGLTAEVVKATLSGHKAFSVQLGPYLNKAQAKLMLRQLQQKNINAILREASTP